MKNTFFSIMLLFMTPVLNAAAVNQNLSSDVSVAMGTSGGGNPPAMTTEIEELLGDVNAVDLEMDLTKTPIEKTVLPKDLEAIFSAGLNKRPLPLTTKDGKLIELSPDKFVFDKGRLTIPIGARTMILYKAAEDY